VIQNNGQFGNIKLTATAKGLAKATVKIKT
jgi:hypothetical protein